VRPLLVIAGRLVAAGIVLVEHNDALLLLGQSSLHWLASVFLRGHDVRDCEKR